MVDGDLGIHGLLHEGDDVIGRDPWSTEACGNIRRPQISRLDALKRRDVALKGRIQVSRRACCYHFRANRTRQIGIGRLPGVVGRIAEDGFTQLIDHTFHVTMQQLGDMIGIDVAALVENHSERI